MPLRAYSPNATAMLPDFIDPSWMFLLGVALLVVILLKRSYRHYRKKKKKKAVPATNASAARQPLSDAPTEVLRWQVEMHDTARDLKAELDSKISVVQTLIGMARTESARLETAIEHARRLGLPASRDTLDEIDRLADEMSDNLRRRSRLL